MHYREFIYSTARHIVKAAQCGNYDINPNIDLSGVLTEDDAVEVTAWIMHTEHFQPAIKKVGERGYRVTR